ncbi:MAG: hypothetical protein IJQ12_08015 [Lachnospiraceae bacterium]|nr:hypothetical protein [Lachnospiraceae bacterium]
MEIGSMLEIQPSALFEGNRTGSFALPLEADASYHASYYNTGRSAITHLLQFLGRSRRVFLPSFICTSVTDAVHRAGNPVVFYPVGEDLQPDSSFLSSASPAPGDLVYICQYFGTVIEDDAMELFLSLQKKGILLIEDITMSLLSTAGAHFAFGDYLIGSIRKWFAVPDGGILYGKEKLPELPGDVQSVNEYTTYYFTAQMMKQMYLDAPDLYDKDVYLSLMRHANDVLFSDYTIRPMSDLGMRLLESTDVAQVRKQREDNYRLLHGLLSDEEAITLLPAPADGMIPFCLFLLNEKRDDLLRRLIDADIYCNIHWRPNDATDRFPSSCALAKNCLSIPADQRYGASHMQHIATVLKDALSFL